MTRGNAFNARLLILLSFTLKDTDNGHNATKKEANLCTMTGSLTGPMDGYCPAEAWGGAYDGWSAGDGRWKINWEWWTEAWNSQSNRKYRIKQDYKIFQKNKTNKRLIRRRE